MSIKHFCDICDKELHKGNVLREIEDDSGIHVRYGQLGIRFILFDRSTSNSGDYCKYCVFDAIDGIDDRAKEVLHNA